MDPPAGRRAKRLLCCAAWPAPRRDSGQLWRSPYPFGPNKAKTSKWLIVARGRSERGMPLAQVGGNQMREELGFGIGFWELGAGRCLPARGAWGWRGPVQVALAAVRGVELPGALGLQLGRVPWFRLAPCHRRAAHCTSAGPQA